MNVYLQELKNYRKSTIVWALSLTLLSVIFLSMFPAFTKDITASQKILEGLPPAVRDGLGLSLKYFFTIFGFYSYMLTYILLAAAVQAMNLGVGIISKEVSGKTADFLMTKPISRASVMTSKFLAAVSLLLMTNVFLVTATVIAAKLLSPDAFSTKIFILLASTVLLVQIAFLALGILLAAFIPKIKSVISVSLPTVFTLFIIGTLGAILGNNSVRYISAFKFYDTTYIIVNSTYEIRFIALETVLVATAIILSYVAYIKKDIRAS